MNPDPKDEAQKQLRNTPDLPKEWETYQHFKGGLYTIVCTSIMEDTLEPLVTYRSKIKGTNTTRKLKIFTETVGYSADNPNGPCPRFLRFKG